MTSTEERPALTGATAWLNSPPLDAEALAGRVALIDFWTLTCINWLRTAPYIRAWADAYRDDGLVVVGVHSPEFTFEKDLDRVREAVADLDVTYPVAVDTNFAVWRAFHNNYWPAVYLLDTGGRVQGHHYGEGRYADLEAQVQDLLEVDRPLVTPLVRGYGIEAPPDWTNLLTAETYLGSARGVNLGRTNEGSGHPAGHSATELVNGEWALTGEWRITAEHAALQKAGGKIAMRFHSRDVHLVLATDPQQPIGFRVTLNGEAPGPSHGVDVDADGHGTVEEGRLYGLIRRSDEVREDTVEVTFEEPGVRAYAFTFG